MSMSDRDGYIWYDGKMVPWREATTHVLTYTLHYGAGCFEGVRALRGVRRQHRRGLWNLLRARESKQHTVRMDDEQRLLRRAR